MNDSELSEADRQRIEITVSCRDCELLPKVANAGEVIGAGPDAIQIMHNGVKTFCGSHYGTYNVEVIRRLRGHHEPQEELAFYEVLKTIKPGGTILELGCFWAYYSLWFLNEVPSGTAILVEPVPSGIAAAKRNFELNKRNGKFIHAAISDVEESSHEIELWPGFTTTAPVLTVDSILESNQVKALSILHADIQGHELRMLIGAEKSLAAHVPQWVFVSTHSENIHEACIKELKRHRYSITVQHTPAESHSVDGLIVASASGEKLNLSISRRRSWKSLKAKTRAKIRIHLLEPFGLRTATR